MYRKYNLEDCGTDKNGNELMTNWPWNNAEQYLYALKEYKEQLYEEASKTYYESARNFSSEGLGAGLYNTLKLSQNRDGSIPILSPDRRHILLPQGYIEKYAGRKLTFEDGYIADPRLKHSDIILWHD